MFCPICKNADILEKDTHYKCPNCSFTINKVILQKVITRDIVKELCQNGRTEKIQGFISKKGKPFKAALKLEGNKIAFEFNDNKVDNSATQIRIHSGVTAKLKWTENNK